MSPRPPKDEDTRLLVINPNSSEDMTHGMEQAISNMALPSVRYNMYINLCLLAS